MELDDECRVCLFNSQMKKVEREQTDETKLNKFKAEVKTLCETAPVESCAPLLMRSIDALHREIFGNGIDYSREKSLFNRVLLDMENELYSRVIAANDPIKEAIKLSTAANYIDFARLSDLNESAVERVMQTAERAEISERTLADFKNALKTAKTLCYLHDNCGEIVLDKILIRLIKNHYPQIKITSVVRGEAIINDVTLADAEEVGLGSVAEVIANGTNVPGTYLKEISPETRELLNKSDVVISKGLGNLETLYGSLPADRKGRIFYAFNCKCAHIAERFSLSLWSAAFIEEVKI